MSLEPSFQINIYQGISIPWCYLSLLGYDIQTTCVILSLQSCSFSLLQRTIGLSPAHPTIPCLHVLTPSPLSSEPFSWFFTWQTPIHVSTLSSKFLVPVKPFSVPQVELGVPRAISTIYSSSQHTELLLQFCLPEDLTQK